MAQSLARVKHRINTVQSTRKITNSMKLVSSVKLRKMNKVVEMQTFYFQAMKRVLNDAIYKNPKDDNSYDSIYLNSFEGVTKTLYIVVTSNMGLCGGYNNNILKYFKDIYKKGDEIIIIGEKGDLNLSKEDDLTVNTNFVKLANDYSMSKVSILVNYIMRMYASKTYKEVDLIFTEYRNSISFIPKTLKVLPITPEPNPRNLYSPIYEPNKQDVINAVIPQYLKTFLYSNIYSALVSEESSRRNTMDAADKNASDLVDKLKLEYNKARQAEITQQITEVVNGSNAVK